MRRTPIFTHSNIERGQGRCSACGDRPVASLLRMPEPYVNSITRWCCTHKGGKIVHRQLSTASRCSQLPFMALFQLAFAQSRARPANGSETTAVGVVPNLSLNCPSRPCGVRPFRVPQWHSSGALGTLRGIRGSKDSSGLQDSRTPGCGSSQVMSFALLTMP